MGRSAARENPPPAEAQINDVVGTSTSAHCKACNLGDFSDPGLYRLMREVFPGKVRQHGELWPVGFEERKCWEVAMALRALEAGGALHPEAEILGVGAGREATLFWLTRTVRRVFATDLYLEAGWEGDANAAMAIDPSAQGPGDFTWNPRRLVVQHMDALNLRYEDESFDAVFSSSSIEHFGELDAIGAAIDEAYRVLKPGGVFSVSTELRLDGPPPGLPGTMMFEPHVLLELVTGDRDWEPLGGAVEMTVDSLTRARPASFSDALADVAAGRSSYSHFPHVVLTHEGLTWTSAHLALRRPSA